MPRPIYLTDDGTNATDEHIYVVVDTTHPNPTFFWVPPGETIQNFSKAYKPGQPILACYAAADPAPFGLGTHSGIWKACRRFRAEMERDEH